jgi:hypothetical protein
MNWNRFNNEKSRILLDSGRLRNLLDDLGCKNIRGSYGDRVFRGPCPIHGGRKPNFQVGPGEPLPIRWACWSHRCHDKFKPSLLGLVRGLLTAREGKNVSAWSAVKYLKQFLKDTPLDARQVNRPPEPKPQAKFLSLSREQVRSSLVIPSPYFVARGYSPALLDAFDVGHSNKLGRSVVPFFDQTGEVCIGYQARSERPQCRKCKRFHDECQPCYAAEFKWNVLAGFPKGNYLYNYHMALRSDSQFVLLVEGPGDVWAATAADALAVASLGHGLSAKQTEKLARLGKRVLVAFDNDDSGRDGAVSTVNRLKAAGVNTRFATLPPEFHDLGSMTPHAVQHWLRGILA